MEKHMYPHPKFRRGASVSQTLAIQGQSQIAPNQQFPSPPVAHQNWGNLPQLPFKKVAQSIPANCPLPLDLTPKPKPKGCQRCMKTKCAAHDPSKPTGLTREQIESYKTQLEECHNRLLEREVKVKDLINLSQGQGDAMKEIHDKLEWYKVENVDLGGTVRKLLGEILKLNDVVNEKKKAVEDYQKTEEEYKNMFEKLEENNVALKGKLKETSQFFRKVNVEFKKGKVNLLEEFCECDDSELEGHREEIREAEGESTPANEGRSVIEEIDEEKKKFGETASILMELTDMGFRHCRKRIEELERENEEYREEEKKRKEEVVPPVSKIHLRKIYGSGNESGDYSSSPSEGSWADDSQWENRVWRIVPQGEGVEQVEEEGDNGDMEGEEDLERPETPPPVLHPWNMEIDETGEGERDDGPYHKRIKRRREAEENEIKNGGEADQKGEGDGGNEKATMESEEFQDGKEAEDNEDLGEFMTLHYTPERIEEGEMDEDAENAVTGEDVVVDQPEAVMDEMMNSLSYEDQKEDFLGPCSEIFCERCFTPFPTQMKKDRHNRFSKSCSIERDNDKEGALGQVGNPEDYDEDEEIEIKIEVPEEDEEDELLDI